MKKTSLWQLCATFFKIGLITFGGGYVMVSIIQREIVEKKQWINEQDMLDMLVIAESTPGAIAINSATFVGYRLRGILGAILATISVVLPSFIIICGLYYALETFLTNVWVASAFKGIRATVCVLIFNAALKLFKPVKKSLFCYILIVLSALISIFTSVNVIFIILSGAVLGLIYSFITAKKDKDLPLSDSNKEGE